MIKIRFKINHTVYYKLLKKIYNEKSVKN